MTFRRYILRNVFRNKRRTALTVLSIGFSLFLLILLWTVLDLLTNPPQTEASALRLVVRRSTTLADELPMAYGDRIARVPHVAMMMPFQWFGGYYQDPKNFFANLAGTPEHLWAMFPELKISEEAKQRFAEQRDAAVAGPALLERFGWKIGDRVTLKGSIYPVDLEFTIVGTYDFDQQKDAFYFRFDYLNEALGDPGTVGSFWLKADSAENIPGIIDTIDAMFRNTAAETKTETEKSFQLGFLAMLGNIQLIIGSVAVVVIFTMLLVAASTMAMTIRERMREVAILKSIGFRRWMVLGFVLGEGLALGALGALLGAGISAILSTFELAAVTKGFIQTYQPTAATYTLAAVIGLGIGLFSGLLPGLHASGLRITDAMRRLE